MSGGVRCEERWNGDVGGVALGIHADQGTAADIVAHNDGHGTPALGPLHLGQKAAATAHKKGDLAGHGGALLQRLDVAMAPAGDVAAAQLTAPAASRIAEATADPQRAAQAVWLECGTEGGGASEEEGGVVVGQADDGGGGE